MVFPAPFLSGNPFPSPHRIFVSAVPGFPLSFWPWQSLMVSIILFFSLVSVSSVSHPLSMLFSSLGFCYLAHLLSLSLSPTVSKLGSCQLSFFPGKPAVKGFISASWSPLGGLLSLWQAELLLAGTGVAPPPRHVLGRRGPVPAGPLPSCCFSPSASFLCLAAAVECQGPVLLRAELGAQVDVCSQLVWEKSVRTSRLWLALDSERGFPVYAITSEGGGLNLSPQDLEGLGKEFVDLRASCYVCKMCMDGYVGEEMALSLSLILRRTPNPTNIKLFKTGLRLAALASGPSVFSLCVSGPLSGPT